MLNFVLSSSNIRYIGKISPIKSYFSIHDGIHDGFQGDLSVNLFFILQNLMQVVKDVKCSGIGLCCCCNILLSDLKVLHFAISSFLFHLWHASFSSKGGGHEVGLGARSRLTHLSCFVVKTIYIYIYFSSNPHN